MVSYMYRRGCQAGIGYGIVLVICFQLTGREFCSSAYVSNDRLYVICEREGMWKSVVLV